MKQNLRLYCKLLVGLLLLVLPGVGWGQSGIIAGWDVSGQTGYGTSPLSPTATNANVIVSGLTREVGVATSGTAAARAWGGSNWSATSEAAITDNKMATFTVKATPGNTLSLSAISQFDYRRSASGPASGLVQYRIDGGSFIDIAAVAFTSTSSAGAAAGPISLSGVGALQNIPASSTVTFRIVPFAASGTGTWYIFDRANTTASDFTLEGIVTPVSAPVPALAVNPTSLPEFTTSLGTTSASQSYSLSAGNLPENITITAPSGTEVSTDDIAFSASLVLPSSTTNATMYARLTGAIAGPVAGTITHVSGSLSATVDVNGTVTTSTPASAAIVISQVYGGGGNSGATYKNDFIELYNRSSATVDLSNWSVQYSSAAGTSWQVTSLSGTIRPGGFYLVQQGAGAGGTADLPTPDAIGTTNMSGTNGKVALTNSTTALSGACPTGSAIIDFVGFGSANCFEGSAATLVLSNTTAAFRKSDGDTDTDDNRADFDIAAPNPRNSAITNGPNLSATPIALTDANGLNYVKDNGPDSKTFSVSGGRFSAENGTITISSSNPVFTVSPSSLTFSGASLSATNVTVQLVAGLTVGGYTGTITLIGGGATLEVPVSGTVANSVNTITLISTIQGDGSTSPLANSAVTIEGVVTRTFAGATGLNGFYVQEEDVDSDNNPATSEGIFVFDPTGAFTGTDGDKVRLTGTVAEFTSTSAGVASSLTQLRDLTIVTNLGATVLPTAVEVKLPVTNVSDLERYEGMLVTMSATEGSLTVTDNFTLGRFGQVVLSATGASNAPGTDARLDQYTQFNLPSVSGYAAYLVEVAKRKIILDDGSGSQNMDPTLFGRGGQPLSATNTLRAGDVVTNITAVLDERFEGYRLQTTTGVNFLPTNERPEITPSVGNATLKVAGFNLLNYFNGDGMGGGFPTSRGANTLAEFNRQRAKTIQAIVKSEADIFAFNELENDGYGPTSAIQDIVNGANDVLGAGTFAFINPGTSTGTDEITVAMIYKPGRVTPVGAAKVIPNAFGNGEFEVAGRKPLAQTFEEIATGARFTVVGNHWKSKGSSSPGAGNVDINDGQGNSNGTRTRQAQDLVSWLATDPTGSNDSDYLILGDLNSYALENPVTTLEAGGYPNLIPNSTYSYAFGGFFGSLDHALGSTSLQTQVTGATKWHINADEPIILDYNTELKSAGQVASLFAPDQFRTSDHDPVIVGLSLVGPLVVEASAAPATICSNGTSELTAIITGGKAPLTYTWTGPGTIATPGNATTQVSDLSAEPQVFTLNVSDSFNQTASTTVTVHVNAQPAAPALANASAVQGTPSVMLSAANCAGTLVWTGASNGSGNSIAVATATPGTFTYSVQCQVGDCTSEPTAVSVTIIPLLTATVAASPGAILTNQSSTLTATVAGGTPGYAYEWTGPGTIANANTATATVSGLTPGQKVFTVTITDATAPIAQVVTKSVSVFVTQANRAPVVTDIANRTSTAGNALSFTISDAFSDPDNDALTYAATGLPAGLALTQGVISGVPSTFGTYTVNITATDPGMLSASSSFTIQVLQGPLRMLDPIYNCTTGQLTVRVIAGNINPIEYYVESVSKGWESTNSFVVEEKKIGKELKLRARQRARDGKGYDEVELQFTPTVCGANLLQMLAPTYDCTTGILTLRATTGNGSPVEYTVSDIAKAWSTQTTYQLEEKQIGKELKLTVRQKDLDGKKYIESEIKFTPVSCPSNQLVMLSPEYDCSTGTLKIKVSGGNGNPIEYEVSSVSKGWESQNTFIVESKQLGKEVKLRARQSEIDGKKYNEVELRFTPASCNAARIGLPETERVTELTLTVLGNPVSDQVRFEIRGAEGLPVQLRLMDLQGRIIEARSINAAAAVEEHTFHVQQVGTGILLLQATTPNQQKLVKVLKN